MPQAHQHYSPATLILNIHLGRWKSYFGFLIILSTIRNNPHKTWINRAVWTKCKQIIKDQLQCWFILKLKNVFMGILLCNPTIKGGQEVWWPQSCICAFCSYNVVSSVLSHRCSKSEAVVLCPTSFGVGASYCPMGRSWSSYSLVRVRCSVTRRSGLIPCQQ